MTTVLENQAENIISLEKEQRGFSWNNFLDSLKSIVGERLFNNWFISCHFITLRANHLTFSVKNKFIRKWVEDNYKSYIMTACNKFDIKTFEISLQEENLPEIKVKSKLEQDNLSQFDDKYTFKNFVVGSSNEIAHAAAFSVADSEYVNKRSNPLFLYGNVGLGKTHLLHAIGHYTQQKFPSKRVLYMSAEKFVQSFVNALMNNSSQFRNLLRSVDILMIDDIQFICGKNKTQEEFFNTFNILLENSKQIVISCDKPPSYLDKIEERLKSRLAWGLTVDIHETNYELRLGILKSKIQHTKYKIQDDVLEFLAENISSSVRELEGGLNKIIMYADLLKVSITLDVAKNIMKDVINIKHEKLSIDEIQTKVCNYYKISLKDMLSVSRKRSLVRARQISMYLAKQFTSYSLIQISRQFDRKDHTTVLHAIQLIKTLYANDENMKQQIDDIIDLLG